MRIYVTHCSAEKDSSLKGTEKKVTPDKLYTATSTRAFMSRCQEKQVNWAILSDLHGVWFPHVDHEWYEKHPDTVTEQEFDIIVQGFDQHLQTYHEIWFYFNPEHFHSFYQKVLNTTNLRGRVKQFTDLEQID